MRLTFVVFNNAPNSIKGIISNFLFNIETNIYCGLLNIKKINTIKKLLQLKITKGRAIIIYQEHNNEGFNYYIIGDPNYTYDLCSMDNIQFSFRKLMIDKLKPLNTI
jgi:hypothetical protein